MNKQVKKKWIKALRSGKYKQTQKTLRDQSGFCCLGVLCDIYQKEKKKKFWDGPCSGVFAFALESDNLPERVQKWAGLNECNPLIGGKSAAFWNDEQMLDFNEIAEKIQTSL